MRLRMQVAACAAFVLIVTAVTYAAGPRRRARSTTAATPSQRGRVTTAVPPSQSARVTTAFDQSWRFLKADAAGADKPEFDDTAWRALNVPHDWSIEGPFDAANKTGHAQGFLPAGVGWYRKHFVLPESYAGRRVFIEFDGVMANSEVWINGQHLGKRPYGYASFRYELTGKLKFGKQENVVAVRADNSGQPASRWYAGAGIYRHVRLVVTDAVHLDNHGVFITTPNVKDAEATVHVQSKVINQSDMARTVTLQISILDPDSKVVKTAATAPQVVLPGHSATFDQDLVVASPMRWDIAHPHLYSAAVRVRDGNKVLDNEDVRFGIREFHFDAATGFWLNGNNFKLKGVCLHHDGGAFGAAVPLGVWRRRLHALRELGVNAIRTAHNPPAPEFLDLTDEMGFLVMDEMFDAWTVAKNPYDYHLYFGDWSIPDTVQTVRRDRNHPSVILYSAGHEIHDTSKAEIAKAILGSLVSTVHQNDPSRPVTQALFRPNVSHDYDNGLADMLDVVGQNYRENEILAAHRSKPVRKIVGTENRHDREAWLALRDNAQYAGQFLWTGIDYLGEAGTWPNIGVEFGLLNRNGVVREIGYERQSWWSDRPMVYIVRRLAAQRTSTADPGYDPNEATRMRRQTLASDWTPQNLKPHAENVEIYSNCEEVELFLNDKPLGSQKLPADASPRRWKVPFAPGTLKAVGRNGGNVVASHELQTAGKPSRILLAVDRQKLAPEWDDVAYVSATVVDDKGVRVPRANDLITFQTSGPGAVVAVDDGDNASHEPFQAAERHAYQGQCFAMVKANGSGGPVTVTASAPGLPETKLNIATVQPGKK